eukprot:2407830-Rhodomonas_salina.1
MRGGGGAERGEREEEGGDVMEIFGHVSAVEVWSYARAMRCPRMVLSALAKCGTEMAYGAMRRARMVPWDVQYDIVWCYAICSTEAAYGAMRCPVLRQRFAPPRRASQVLTVRSAYASRLATCLRVSPSYLPTSSKRDP